MTSEFYFSYKNVNILNLKEWINVASAMSTSTSLEDQLKDPYLAITIRKNLEKKMTKDIKNKLRWDTNPYKENVISSDDFNAILNQMEWFNTLNDEIKKSLTIPDNVVILP